MTTYEAAYNVTARGGTWEVCHADQGPIASFSDPEHGFNHAYLFAALLNRIGSPDRLLEAAEILTNDARARACRVEELGGPLAKVLAMRHEGFRGVR